MLCLISYFKILMCKLGSSLLKRNQYCCSLIYLSSVCCAYSDYLHESIVPTDHFQKSLPRLPIPKLENTCERYLATQKAFLSEDAFKKTKTYTEQFEKEIGKGKPVLHVNHKILTINICKARCRTGTVKLYRGLKAQLRNICEEIFSGK